MKPQHRFPKENGADVKSKQIHSSLLPINVLQVVKFLAEVERLALNVDGDHSWAEWFKEREETGASGSSLS